jgi:hypothetical protein
VIPLIQNLHNDLQLGQESLAASGQQTPFTCRLSVTLNDPELKRVIEVWDVLSGPVKKKILSLMEAAHR